MTPCLPLIAVSALVTGLVGVPQPWVVTMSAVSGPPAPGRPAPAHPTPGPAASGPGSAVPAVPVGPVGPASDVVEHVATTALDSYWTPERMARAIPIDVLSTIKQVGMAAARILPSTASPAPSRSPEAAPAGARPVRQARQARRPGASLAVTSGSKWAAGGAVTRTTGRVFLTMDGVDFVCSASAVRSANKDVVVTAGHCVKDGAGSWAENWTFVPGYRAGQRPYGAYTARRMFVAGPWARGGNDDYDMGMVAVTTANGRHLGDAVGGQEIGFNARRGLRTYGFGFPADPPYNGEHLLYCAGVVHADPQGQTRDQGLRCDLTAGASGGPWLSGFDPATGRGRLTSVSSFKYSNDHRTMYGPYFGAAARDLFQSAQRA
ncbi:trypsin-like serine peptidase [Sphaerimonospora mesophila]|uniref:trypsin-like serine peptidase n=1 Tax=Sphaerimonospora mesophila TaxID=37483 RepID=UPI0006E1869D